MTLPRLEAMSNYWESSPPIHVMIAAYFGIKKKEKPATDIGQLLQDCHSLNGGQ